MGLTVQLFPNMDRSFIDIRKKTGEFVGGIKNLHVMETVNA